MTDELANLAPIPPEGNAAAPSSSSWPQVWVVLLALAALSALGVHMARHGVGQGVFLPALAFLVCLLAAAFDTATARIPNPLTYSAILLGLGLNGLGAGAAWGGFDVVSRWLGAAGASQALAGFALCATIGLPCMFLAGMGGGDMKLLAAMGAILGFSRVSCVLTWTLAAAVVYSLVNLVAFGRLNGLMRSLAAQGLTIIYLRQPAPIEAPSKTVIPLAIPLLVGLILWRVFGALW